MNNPLLACRSSVLPALSALIVACNPTPTPNPPAPPPPPAGQTASLTHEIIWPAAGSNPELQSVRATVFQGANTLGSQVLTRPADSAPSRIGVSFPRLTDTLGLSERLEAFGNLDASGPSALNSVREIDPTEVDSAKVIPVSFAATASIDVTTPGSDALIDDESLTLTATARDASGQLTLVDTGQFEWTSGDPNIAEILPTGTSSIRSQAGSTVSGSTVKVRAKDSGIVSIRITDYKTKKDKVKTIKATRSGPTVFDGIWQGTISDGRFTPTKVTPFTYVITSSPPNQLKFSWTSDFYGIGGYPGTSTNSSFTAAGGVIVGSVSTDGVLTATQASSKQTVTARKVNSKVEFEYAIAVTRRAGTLIEVELIVRNRGKLAASNVRLDNLTLNGATAVPGGSNLSLYPYGPSYGDIAPGIYLRRALVFGEGAIVPPSTVGKLEFTLVCDQGTSRPVPIDVVVVQPSSRGLRQTRIKLRRVLWDRHVGSLKVRSWPYVQYGGCSWDDDPTALDVTWSVPFRNTQSVHQRTTVYNLFMLTLTVTEARARLREALERVKDGEEIELSQNGQVVAVLVHPDKLRARVRTPNTLAAEDRLEALRALRAGPPKRTRKGLSPERAEALVEAVREDRDGDWE